MKLLQINSVYFHGSTGKIVYRIHQAAKERGIDSYVIYSRNGAFGDAYKTIESDPHVFQIANSLELKIHVIKSILFDKQGLYSKKNTQAIIQKIMEINPDIIHLHNIHGYYLNYELLFDYLKKIKKSLIWTLHDCWSFTGYCSHYEANNCYQWQKGCQHCAFRNVYPYRIFSHAKKNFQIKKKAFNIPNLTLVVPSNWLKDELQLSMLSNIPCRVIHNDVNLTNFYPKKTTYLRQKYNLEKKTIILSVASPFSQRKGFNDFLQLANLLDDTYQIVLIGLNNKQLKHLPGNILGILRTESIIEMNDWYNTADVLANLTYEDTYPTVNLEAKAVGLPIIGYHTGGSTEQIVDYGKIVKRGDIKAVSDEIKKMNFIRKPVVIENHMTEEYLALYGMKIKG